MKLRQIIVCLVYGNIFNIAGCTKIELFNIRMFDKMTIVKVKLFLLTLVLNKKYFMDVYLTCFDHSYFA